MRIRKAATKRHVYVQSVVVVVVGYYVDGYCKNPKRKSRSRDRGAQPLEGADWTLVDPRTLPQGAIEGPAAIQGSGGYQGQTQAGRPAMHRSRDVGVYWGACVAQFRSNGWIEWVDRGLILG